MHDPETKHGARNAQVDPEHAGVLDAAGVRVLTVSPRRSVRRRVASMVRGRIERIDFATDAQQASEIIGDGGTDLVIIERALNGNDGIDLLSELTARHPALVGVVLGSVDCADDALRAMRAGACDMVPMGSTGAQATRRLLDAVEKARRVRQRDARLERLKKLCSKLNNARQSVSGQIGELCADLTDAYQDLADKFGEVRLTSELETLLRQELDIESLLRTLLEFMLSRLGSVNAAVFMPTSSGDYSVGAYVNYDLSRDTAEVLLDQLADEIPGHVEDDDSVRTMSGRNELSCVLGDGAGWVEDSTMMTVSCRDGGECLAVIAVFRDRSRPLTDEDAHTLGVIGRLFAVQLGRVIRTHHRHLPKDQWGLSGDWDVAPDDHDPMDGPDGGYPDDHDGWYDQAA